MRSLRWWGRPRRQLRQLHNRLPQHVLDGHPLYGVERRQIRHGLPTEEGVDEPFLVLVGEAHRTTPHDEYGCPKILGMTVKFWPCMDVTTNCRRCVVGCRVTGLKAKCPSMV